MNALRSITLLVALAFTAGACGLLPTVTEQLPPDLVPNASSEYRTANAAFHVLLELHVDKPTSEQILAGAIEGANQYLADQAGGGVQVGTPAFAGGTESDFQEFAAELDEVVAANPSIDPVLLERAATDGMARSMNECHTYYLDPERARGFNQPPQEYSGIGATIAPTTPNEPSEIGTVFPDTPAERAGVRSGDKIIAVDGENVVGFTPEEIANRIRGAEGTTVTITFERDGERLEIPIVRARITPPRVIPQFHAEGEIGHIFISALNGDVTQQAAEAVERMVEQGVSGIVLDLRNNPGGDLSAAVDIASIFIQDGVLVYQVGRDGQQKELRTNGRLYRGFDLPLVVLVNERSASGAEIIAAGVRANDAGTVIGERTAGCVGIGQPREMPDGGLLLVTLARMQDAVTGENLNGEGNGVVPDRIVEDEEAQLEAAIEELRRKTG